MLPRLHPSRPRPRLLSFLGLAASAGLFGACVHRPPTVALPAADISKGYYFHTHSRPNNSSDTLFILCFSGGGTRAAALSYGVLEELRNTRVETDKGPRSLLDEVDAISSVSGGSVTAAAYALYGDAMFDRLEQAFLKRNIQRLLLTRALNPFRWNKLWSKTYGTSDLAAELYDEVLFHGATFADLARRPGAYTVINSTDITTGARFSFTQDQFDLICSDLSGFRVSQAVAASSAVPGLLSPVTLNNYAGRCNAWMPDLAAARSHLENDRLPRRSRFHLTEIASYLDATNRPYLHLVDGGVADNLGIRAVLDGLLAIESNTNIRDLFDLAAVRRVVFVVVDAASSPDRDWDKREQPPGTLQIAFSGATIPMSRYSIETQELLRDQLNRWRESQRSRSGDSGQALEFYSIDVSFAAVEDPKERPFFFNLPTSFTLPDTSVDRLRAVGGRLLRESKEFRAFLAGLGTATSTR
ncbi:MAG: patatin-like phospholipase family protein [Verrucomicrobiales bacterium]|nr:patatin-like phospholipase family protein [Verrucomicrobiales bacterium]